MKTVTKIICSLMIVTVLMAFMGTSVFATENGTAWLSAEAADGNTVISIVTDAVVADGLVELTYSAEDLTYTGLVVNEGSVAAYSVNADTAGTVKLAWVAPGAYENEQGLTLITLTFQGTSGTAVTMSGELNDAQGNAITIREMVDADTSELKKAVLMARSLEEANYTAESFQAMQTALTAAETVLESFMPTQEDVDAAAEALLAAIDALQLQDVIDGSDVDFSELKKAILKAKALNRYDYTKESFAAVESAQADAEAVLANAAATQEQVDAAAHALNIAISDLVLGAGVPDTGFESLTVPFIALIVLSAAGVVTTVMLLNSKKGRCAK